MQTSSTPTISLFYAYAPEDEQFCADLDKHLAAMKRLGWVRTWYDRDIKAGQMWEDEINRHLSTADIILLLVSADFLASDYCYSVELQFALQRHEMGTAVVIPIIIRPVDWSITPFHGLQALPIDGRAIVNWANRDQAFFDISQGLRRIIGKRIPQQIGSHAFHRSSQSLWTVPYRQNRFFTGRDDILTELSSYFSSWNVINTPIASLSGIGGVGKTQIALEYAYQSSDTYQAIFWINATSHDTFLADIVTLTDILALPPTKGMEPSAVVSLVKRWLSSHTQWLLILDGVFDLSLVAEIIPLRSSGHVLLTTQALVISRTYAHLFEIEKLTEQKGLELLLRRTGLLLEEQKNQHIASEDVTEALHIYHALDGLPLALDQAGAYIEETGCSLAEYHHRYQQQQLTILSLRGGHEMSHPASVVTTWSLSFAYLEQQDACAADLLRACAFLASEVIPQQIFLRGAAFLGPCLESLLTDETRFDGAIKILRQIAFVRRFPQAQTLSLHRLVQVVLRSQMVIDEQALWAQRVVQALCVAFPQRTDQEWARCSLYIPHVSVCERLLENYHLDCPAAGALFYRAGRFFHDHAQYIQAEHLYLRALSIKEILPPDVEPEGIIEVLESLGWLTLDQGQFARAEPFFLRAQVLKEHLYGHEHLEMAITLHALGRLAHAQYRYKEAEALYLEALHIKEHTAGAEDAETATTLHALGWLLQDRGQYDVALSYYQNALLIRFKVLGSEHVSTSITIHELARLAHRQKKYEQAEKLYLESLSIKKRILSSEHPFIAIAMDALAHLYQDQNRAEEAETFYQHALTIREQYFGPEHQFTAEVIHHLACMYQEQRQLQQAEILLVRAVDIREQTLGSNHPITAISLHQLARLYSLQQRWDEADVLYQRVLAIREQALGPLHPSTQSVMRGYAQFLRSLQRDTDALVLEQRFLNQEEQEEA
jgi:tetratricopeptide (TPR) repeat protein